MCLLLLSRWQALATICPKGPSKGLRMAPLPCWLRRALHLEDLERRRAAAPLKLRDPKSLRVGAFDVGSRTVGVLATTVVKELSKSARVVRPTTRDGTLEAFERSFCHAL